MKKKISDVSSINRTRSNISSCNKLLLFEMNISRCLIQIMEYVDKYFKYITLFFKISEMDISGFQAKHIY